MLQEDQPVSWLPKTPGQRFDSPVGGGAGHLRPDELRFYFAADEYSNDPHVDEPLLDLNLGLFTASRANPPYRDSGHIHLLWRCHYDSH